MQKSHANSKPQMPKSGSKQNNADLVNGWVSPSRYKKTQMRSAKRYAHCHLAHSSRWHGRKRSIIWTGKNVEILGSTSEGEKRYAHCHFRHSSVLNEHVGALEDTKNQSLVNMNTHTSKQNNQNNWAKHVKICTCKFRWKITTAHDLKNTPCQKRVRIMGWKCKLCCDECGATQNC